MVHTPNTSFLWLENTSFLVLHTFTDLHISSVCLQIQFRKLYILPYFKLFLSANFFLVIYIPFAVQMCHKSKVQIERLLRGT